MQSDYFASGGWQKLIETLLTGLMQPSVHEVPSKTPDARYWHLADIGLCAARVCF